MAHLKADSAGMSGVTKGLRVGYIPYLNCAPFFHYLNNESFSGSITAGVPSLLNRMLQTGDIDVSPSSSFEYALHSENYLLLPQYSISSLGPVKSVLLFAPCSLDELRGRKIAITGESATSINLLRVLLLEFTGLSRVDDYVPVEPVEALIKQGHPALLIGDRAMKQVTNLPEGMRCYDLGELWHEFTGLPFVFALWILRRAAALDYREEILSLQQALAAALQQAFNDLPLLATKMGKVDAEITPLVEYWQTIDYSLTQDHLAGLDLFYRLCLKYGYLQKMPQIEFFHG